MRLAKIARIGGSMAVMSCLLVACGEEQGTQPQAASTPTTAATANAGESRVEMAKCQTPSGGNVHFKLGGSVLRVPANSVEDTIPEGMQQPLKKEAVRAAVQEQVSAGGGCPEKPLNAVLLMVRDKMEHPLLQGSVGLLKTSPGGITDQFAKLTTQLRDKPAKNCRQLKGKLLACVGTETRGGRETQVMYVISQDRKARLNTGGPLTARCLLEGEAIRGCNIVDQLNGDVTVDLTLNPGEYTSDDLRDARRTAMARVEQWKL